jgi:hypothetical protein
MSLKYSSSLPSTSGASGTPGSPATDNKNRKKLKSIKQISKVFSFFFQGYIYVFEKTMLEYLNNKDVFMIHLALKTLEPVFMYLRKICFFYR